MYIILSTLPLGNTQTRQQYERHPPTSQLKHMIHQFIVVRQQRYLHLPHYLHININRL